MFFWRYAEQDEVLYATIIVAAGYWAVIGAMMTGEAPQLSPRARRSLPQSFLGRAFLTWFNPGSGTGYAFAVANLAALAIMVAAAGIYAQWLSVPGAPDDVEWLLLSMMCVSYVAAYLGVGRLLLLFVRRFVWGGLAMAFVIQIFLAAMGAVLPFLIQLMALGVTYADEYTLLQTTNWAWTLYAVADEEIVGVDNWVYVIVPMIALGVFLLNLAFAAREVAAEREQTPQRVVEDELQLHPEKAPKPVGPQNPWDYDTPAEPAPS
jgi:hypothetical protein